jgi:hypothetical protein
MHTDVTFAQRPENGIGYCVAECVAVGMALWSAIARNVDATQDK